MPSLTSLLLSSNNLILHATLAISLSLFLSVFKIPSVFLNGLHTYIHPDDVTPDSNKSSSTKAVIRRPGVVDSQQIKPRKKSKDRFEFDENKAQIFRLKLIEGHLATRIYYKEFYGVFNSSFIALSSFLLHTFLNVDKDSGFVKNGSIIPLLLGLVAVCRVCILIVWVAFERSASKTLDKQLSVVWGIFGFVFGVAHFCNVVPRRVLDFGFQGSFTGFEMTILAALMGGVGGFLYMPALRNARAFWIGTDQIHSNLSIISCGWFSRALIYANYVLAVFTSLLWITPFADFLVKTNSGGRKDVSGVNGTELVGYIGISVVKFHQLRNFCLVFTGLVQILTMRPNVQMFLNEAVLCWYQRLHASKLPDLDYSRAKVFLHNHYLCLAVLQFFAPGALLLLLLGFSQFDINIDFVNKLPVFMAWWLVFVWTVFNTAILALYRRGIFYVS